MKTYKKYGRRKASTWNKPHKANRTTANRAVRTAVKRETAQEAKAL